MRGRWNTKQDNPETRSKALTELLHSELDAIDPETHISRARMMARALIDKACQGDIRAIREIFDRVEGRPPQALVGDPEEEPVKVIIERNFASPLTPDEWAKKCGPALGAAPAAGNGS